MKRLKRSKSERSIQHPRMKRSTNSQLARSPSPTSSLGKENRKVEVTQKKIEKLIL
ncbi:hypothetical protein ACLOJK_003772 [Asimina triloba]